MAIEFRRATLPLDIVYNILISLPVKTLCRFKCVCKEWYTLLHDPGFQLDHYDHRRSQQNPFLLLSRNPLDYASGIWSVQLSIYNSKEKALINRFSYPLHSYFWVRPVQSCLGLVCFRLFDDQLILLCNPSTEEIIALPSLLLPPPQPLQVQLDQIGFGFLPRTKEFKVVRFFGTGQDIRNLYCKIFTLGSSLWRESRCPPAYQKLHFTSSNSAPFAHGAVHLLPDFYLHHRDKDYSILAFDLESEEYTTVRLPNFFYERRKIGFECHIELAELGESLCIILGSGPAETTVKHWKRPITTMKRWKLWRLKDYESGIWDTQYTIDVTSFTRGIRWIEPLQIMDDGSMLLEITQGFNQSLYSYNPQEKKFTLMSIDRFSGAIIYHESLLSLKSNRNLEFRG